MIVATLTLKSVQLLQSNVMNYGCSCATCDHRFKCWQGESSVEGMVNSCFISNFIFFFSFFSFLILDTSSWRINYMIYPSYLADFDWDKKIRWFEDIFRDFYLSHFRLFYCRKFLLYLMLLSLFLPIIIFLQFYLNYIIYIYIENINSNYFFSPSQFFFYKIYRINI